MGCKSTTNTTLTPHNFSLDEMYEENYSLQQIHKIFNHLDKNWKSLDQRHATLLEEIHDYLEQNHYNCYVCGVYFEDHAFTNPDHTRQECYSCFAESSF